MTLIILIAIMLTLASPSWTQAPPVPTPRTMNVIEVDEPTFIVMKDGTRRICIQNDERKSTICWTVPEGTTSLIEREFASIARSNDTCRTRLAEALRKAREYIGVYAEITWGDPLTINPAPLRVVLKEIDALLQECP